MTNCNGKCAKIKVTRNAKGSMYDLGYVRCLHDCNCYFKKTKAITKNSGRLACPCCGGWVKTGTYFKTKKRVEILELVVLA